MDVRVKRSGRGCWLLACLSLAGTAFAAHAPWPRLASHALAQADARAPSVSTRVDPCVPVELTQFHRVLAIELGTSIDYSADSSRKGGLTTVWLSCRPDGIELHLEDGVTRKSMTRVVDVARIEAASRSRLLALAVAEFVVASWVELRLPTPAALEPVPPLAARHVQHAISRYVGGVPSTFALRSAPEWRLGLGFDAIGFVSAGYPVPGASLQLLQRALWPLEFSLGVQVAHRDVRAVWNERELGDIRLTLLSALLSLRYTAELGAFDLSVGAGGRVGVANMVGHTSVQGIHASAFFGRFGGPALVFGVAYHASAQLRLVLEAEAGLVLQPVLAKMSDTVLLRLDQGWLGGSLGLAWAL
jgi:hypothetical protein